MRLPVYLLLSLAAFPVQAQTTADPPAAPSPHAAWEQHFSQANVSHDGHLTLEQAKIGYATVARHFRDIDLAHKGYVTEDDMRAWHKQQRDSRHAAQASADDGLHPSQAIRHAQSGQPAAAVPNQSEPTAPAKDEAAQSTH